jgi:hypothetical protein
MIMFAFDRSALAVLAPLALLVGVVLWSNFGSTSAAAQQARVDDDQAQQSVAAAPRDEKQQATQTVAANLPSR